MAEAPSTPGYRTLIFPVQHSLARALNPAVGEVFRMRAKFKVMTLTDAAADRVRRIVESSDDPILGLRVGVRNGGCAGMSYTMEYAREQRAGEDVVEDKGVRVFVDPKAVLFLLGTQMDFQTTKLASQFVFNNPNQTSACGCGESVAITPVDAGALHATA